MSEETSSVAASLCEARGFGHVFSHAAHRAAATARSLLVMVFLVLTQSAFAIEALEESVDQKYDEPSIFEGGRIDLRRRQVQRIRSRIEQNRKIF